MSPRHLRAAASKAATKNALHTASPCPRRRLRRFEQEDLPEDIFRPGSRPCPTMAVPPRYQGTMITAAALREESLGGAKGAFRQGEWGAVRPRCPAGAW